MSSEKVKENLLLQVAHLARQIKRAQEGLREFDATWGSGNAEDETHLPEKYDELKNSIDALDAGVLDDITRELSHLENCLASAERQLAVALSRPAPIPAVAEGDLSRLCHTQEARLRHEGASNRAAEAEHAALLVHYRAVLHDLSRPQPKIPADIGDTLAHMQAEIAKQAEPLGC